MNHLEMMDSQKNSMNAFGMRSKNLFSKSGIKYFSKNRL